MIRMTTMLRLTAVIALAALLGGCATGAAKKPPTGTPEPDKFLFDRGTENLNKRRWIVAREYFRQLVDSYPQSPYRADAKLGIGDTYIGEKSPESFVLAINEFREFLNFYPTHKRAYYAQFKLAMAHFYQMKDPMRDQTETREIRRPAARRRSAPAPARSQGSARCLARRRRGALLPDQVVSRRHRPPHAAAEGRPGLHQSRQGLFPAGRIAREGEAPGGSAALLRTAGQGVRAERIPRTGQEADRRSESDPAGRRWQGRQRGLMASREGRGLCRRPRCQVSRAKRR